MKRLLYGAAMAAAILVLPVTAGAGGPATDGAPTAGIDTGSALVLLNGEPLSTYEKTKPAPGKKVDFTSKSTKSYRAQLSAFRNDFKQWLRANAPKAKVTGEFDLALNAVGVQLNGESLATIAAAPMALSAELPVALLAGRARRSRSRARQRLPGMDRRRWHSDREGRGFQGRDRRHGDRHHASVLLRRKSAPTTVRSRTTRSRTRRCSTTRPAAAATRPRTSTVTARTSPAPSPATSTHLQSSTESAIPYAPSGVAPAAMLGNYNVFPGEDGNARSEDILDALEAAYEDGFDIANMSLGGDSSGVKDLLAMARRQSRPGEHGDRCRRRQQRPAASARSSRPARRRGR